MKNLFLLIILFQISLNLFSQKEVFFSTKAHDSIKVESMQGIEIQTHLNPFTTISSISHNLSTLFIPISIGYFNEKRIAPTWTIISSANITYDIYRIQNPVLADSIFNGYFTYKTENSYSLGINLSVEPRLYFSYKSLHSAGKANLNSGCYLSLPVSYGITLISNSEFFNKPTWIYDKYYGSLYFTPAFGYRQAINKRFFLEGDIRYISGTFGFYVKNKTFFITGPFLLFSPTISLKAAYKF